MNPVTNKVYVTNASVNNGLPFQGTMVIDGASNTVIATVPAGAAATNTPGVIAVAVNPLTNHVYIGAATAPGSATVSVIDGINDTIGTVLAGDSPDAIALNPVTNQIYVTNYAPWANSFVTKITEQPAQLVPLPVTIAFLGQPGVDFVGESTVNDNPAFQFLAASNFLPFGLPIQNVYYQVDTWQGAWQQAMSGGANFTGQLSSVSLGNHVLYAYATDSQDATLSPGSALTGPVAAFPFTVVQPPTQVSLGPQSVNGSPDLYNSTVTVVGRGFQPGDTLQIVFRNLPDVIPLDAPCIVCSALHSHLEDVLAPSLATVSSDGTFQVAEVVMHNIEFGSASGPVTILVESTKNVQGFLVPTGIVEATGVADASYWIGPIPADL